MVARGSRAFVQEVTVAINTRLEQVAKAALQRAALQAITRVRGEQSGRAGIAPVPRIYVDGSPASLSSITASSRVAIDWNYLQEAVTVIMDRLRETGPQLKDDWKNSITCFVGGAEVDPANLPNDAFDALIVITVPYARRLEVGKDKNGGPFVKQVPMHFVEKTALELRPRLRSLARIGFQYADLEDAYTLESPQSRIRRRYIPGRGMVTYGAAERRLFGAAETKVRYPAIWVEEIRAI